MTTVGEPIEPAVWQWYYDEVGKARLSSSIRGGRRRMADSSAAPNLRIDQMKPGSAGPGVPGIYPVIYDEEGKEVPRGHRKGREHLHQKSLARNLPDDLG